MIYQEIRTYSPMIDGDVMRVSTVDERNSEYFALVRRPDSAKMWRQLKEKVLDALEAVIQTPVDERPGPGEIQLPAELRD